MKWACLVERFEYSDSRHVAPACERFDGFGRTPCEACVKTYCMISPAAVACCVIEKDEPRTCFRNRQRGGKDCDWRDENR
jgi:hypothetical protein